MTTIDPCASASDFLAALRARHISAEELLECMQRRIQLYNPILNAIVTPGEDARSAAHQADRARSRGEDRPLLGLPITIKDAIDVAGLPTTGGLRRRAQEIAAQDAPLVARLRAAGAVIMGKTNVPPYVADWQTDNPLFGRTNNPWDLSRTPGGSTGGGAAAVAACLSPLEFGSDIGGSIRIPAAFCGIYGHRPSETAFPHSGHWPGSPLPNVGDILNVLGPLARSAPDLSLALDAAVGPDVGEDVAWRITLPAPRHRRLVDFRVAVLPPLPWLPLAPEVSAAVEHLIERLRDEGVRVAEAVPQGFGDGRAYLELYASLLAAVFAVNRMKSPERLQTEAAELRATGDPFDAARAAGLTASAGELLTWYSQREQFRAAFRQFFGQWDVLIAPITPLPAFPHDSAPYAERTLSVAGVNFPYRNLVALPGLATLSGQPATAFPASQNGAGLPVGLQAIGPYLEDHTTIHFTDLIAEHWGGYQPPPGFPPTR